MNGDGTKRNDKVVVMGYILLRDAYPVISRWVDNNIETLWYQLRRLMRLNNLEDPSAAISMVEDWFAAHPEADVEDYF